MEKKRALRHRIIPMSCSKDEFTFLRSTCKKKVISQKRMRYKILCGRAYNKKILIPASGELAKEYARSIAISCSSGLSGPFDFQEYKNESLTGD